MLSVVMDVVMESDKNTGSRDSIVGNSSLSNCHLVGESSVLDGYKFEWTGEWSGRYFTS